MPGAALPVAKGVGTAVGGARAGKKGQGDVSRQRGLQEQQAALSGRAFELGAAPFEAATDYYSRLLEGGQTARLAVEPALAEIDFASEAARKGIEAQLPRGGERNLALAQSRVAQAGTRGKAYTGRQGEAAQALGALSGVPFGVAPAFGGTAAGAGGGLLEYGLGQQRLAAAGASGAGRSIYQLSQKGQDGGGKGQGGFQKKSQGPSAAG